MDSAGDALEILSVGCEGIITPGGWLFAGTGARPSGAPGLVMGQARTPPIPLEDRYSLKHMFAAERAVRAAMRAAGLNARQVALVLIKSRVHQLVGRPTETSPT